MVGSAPDLAAFIAEGTPRVLSIWSPPGYGKIVFARAYAKHAGVFTLCEVSADRNVADLARPLHEALVGRDSSRAVRSAADRLAQRREQAAASSREALRREWMLAGDPELFVVYDPSAAFASPAGADLLAELVAALPPKRTLAIVGRAPLPPALQQIIGREGAAVVGPSDLALGSDDERLIAERAGVAADAVRAIHDVAGGWPLVTRLLVGLIAQEPEGELLDALAAMPREALLGFAAHRTIARLKDVVREALVVAVLRRGASHADLVRVLGEECDDLVFERLSSLPFVERDAGRVTVHPEIASLLRVRFGAVFKALFDRTLHVLSGDGAYVEAARVALDEGSVARAAAIIDAAPPYTAAPVPLHDYERIIDRMDRALITQYPNVWIATIPYRNYAVDRSTFVREAETVYFCMAPVASLDQRAAVLMVLASAYANGGRIEESEQLIEEALTGFARERTHARAAILNFVASLRGIGGRFSEARALALEAATISRDGFGENQTLHYIEAHEATYRGKIERAIVVFDELLRRREREALPLYTALAAANAALFTWANGDNAAFDRYLTILEDAVTPGIERGFAPIIDAARGRKPQLDDQYPSPLVAAHAQLYRLGASTDRHDALVAARAAAHAADQRRDPYVQTLAHVALYVLDERARQDEARTLRAIIASVESPELNDAVEDLLHDRPPGILEPFVHTRVLRERVRSEPRLVVELLGARVTRDGLPVRLTDKEFELVALLASAHGSLSRDRIGEALWEHLDPEEWPNNLKVTLSRVRSKLGVREAVLSGDGRYRLSPAFEVDLRRAEAVVRECRNGSLDETTRGALRGVIASYGSGAGSRYERRPSLHASLARIQELVCTAGTILAKDSLMRGRFDDALSYAREVADIDPFHEAACEVVVGALRERGDIDAARREFRRYATALATELGATPSRRLADLLRTVELSSGDRHDPHRSQRAP
jgi:DNA-binding SARP family transcriptional activator